MILGQARVWTVGTGTAMVRVPDDWAAANGLHLGDDIYVLGALDGTVRFFAKPVEFAKPVRFRMRDRGYPVMTIPAMIARPRGMDKGCIIEFESDGDVLVARKVVEEDGE